MDGSQTLLTGIIAYFYRVSAHWHAILIQQICLSVCLSVRPWRSGIRWKRLTMVIVFLPYGSAIILVLSASNIFTKFRQRHPLRGAKYRWSINISRFSTNKSLYPVNDTDSAIVTGRRIGAHMRSIKWCHFQWPWTNPDLFSRSLPVDLIN